METIVAINPTAVALHSLAPAEVQAQAREIVLDDDDVRAASLNALDCTHPNKCSLRQVQALSRDCRPPRPGRLGAAFCRLRQHPAARGLLATAPALAIALFPKCPVCWAAYLSVFGLSGLQAIPYSPWLLPVFVLLMAVNAVAVLRRSRSSGAMGGFYLSLLGSLAVLAAQLGTQSASYLGLALVFAGSLLSRLAPGANPLRRLAFLVPSGRRKKTDWS